MNCVFILNGFLRDIDVQVNYSYFLFHNQQYRMFVATNLSSVSVQPQGH